MPVFGSLEILPTIIGTTYNGKRQYFRDLSFQFSLKVINVFFLPPSIGPQGSKIHGSTNYNYVLYSSPLRFPYVPYKSR